MFTLNDDLSIYATRGDIVFFSVSAEEDGKPYKFQAGDVVRIKVFGKKDAESVVLQKDFPVLENAENVEIFLTGEDTKLGEVISKPKDYWYEVELNPDTNPQTIIGYGEDGAAVFKLFPEGADVKNYEPDPEDFPVVDDTLDMTSPRPIANSAVAAALAILKRNTAKDYVTPQMYGAVGDGVADDTQAILDAVSYCGENGFPLHIPAGTYCVSVTIDIPAYLRFIGETGKTVIKSTASPAFKIGDYAELSGVSAYGSGDTMGIELNGGRVFIHDVTIQDFDWGIMNNTANTNLSRISRVTILDCNRGISLTNANNSNSQSMTFYDIDIRGCFYGLVSYQPGNKFINFCVQGGQSGGTAIILENGANNNEFVGTYIENPNYENEVNFTTSQYNRFTGGRPLQYGNAFVNNDGTNIVLTRSIQYDGVFERGTVCHEGLGVIAKETEAGQPSAVVVAKNNGDNKVILQTLGTSVGTEFGFENIIVREDELVHVSGSRKHKGFGLLTYSPTHESFTDGELVSVVTSAIGTADLVFVQCTTPGVHAWIENIGNGYHRITARNENGADLSGVKMTYVVLFANAV